MSVSGKEGEHTFMLFAKEYRTVRRTIPIAAKELFLAKEVGADLEAIFWR